MVSKCSGCYPIYQPNQEAHMYDGGCLSITEEEEQEEESVGALLKENSELKLKIKELEMKLATIIEKLRCFKQSFYICGSPSISAEPKSELNDG